MIGGQPFQAKLHGTGGGFALWIEDTGWFGIDPNAPAIVVPREGDPAMREQRLWGIPAALCFVTRGDLSIHAAAVEVDGSALLLAAPGGHGKTTLAGGFLRAGYRVLGEDTACCRVSGHPVILPGPALLRVRPDVYRALRFPSVRQVDRGPYRMALALDDSAGDGAPVRIAGVVFLRQDETTPRIEPVDAAVALRDLWALAFRLPSEEHVVRSFEMIATLAAAVPAWNLYRRLDFENLLDVVDLVIDTCLE